MVWSKNCYSSYWLWMQDYRIWFHTWTSIRVCVLCALRNPKAAQRSQSESLSGSTTGWASWKSSTQNRVNCEPETTSLKSTVFPQSLWSRSVMNIVLDNSSCCSKVMNKTAWRSYVYHTLNIYALDLETLRYRYLGKFWCTIVQNNFSGFPFAHAKFAWKSAWYDL